MRRSPLFLVFLLVLLLAGCRFPGMVRPGSTTPNKPVQYGNLRVAIRWPQRLVTQGIPDSANFIRLRVFKDGAICQVRDSQAATQSVDVDEVYPRGAAGSISASSYRLPIGSGYFVEIRAYKDCPYKGKDGAAQTKLDADVAASKKILRHVFPTGDEAHPLIDYLNNDTARIVAEGIRANETIRLPSFDQAGNSDSTNLTITLDQTVLVAGIGGSAGSNSPDLPPGIDLGGVGGYPNYLGDARFRELKNPQGLFFDKEKNDVYFCDEVGIQLIDAAGNMPDFKTKANSDSVGDGKAPTSASLGVPGSICFAKDPTHGNTDRIFIADEDNKRVRSTEDDIIHSYIDYHLSRQGKSDIVNPAVNAQIDLDDLKFTSLGPVEVKQFGGETYTYAVDESVVLQHRTDRNGGKWAVFAGDVQYQLQDGSLALAEYPATASIDISFSKPVALLAQTAGLVVADQSGTSGALYRFDHDIPTDGSQHPLMRRALPAGYSPTDLAAGPSDDVVFLACSQSIIRYNLTTGVKTDLISPSGAKALQTPAQVSSDGDPNNYSVSSPRGVAFDAVRNELYFSLGAYIFKLTYASGGGTPQLVNVAGSGRGDQMIRDGLTPSIAPFHAPGHLVVVPSGKTIPEGLYVADETDQMVYQIKREDGLVYRFAGGGLVADSMTTPVAITYSAKRGRIYVTDIGKERFTQHVIWEVKTDGTMRPVAGNPSSLREDMLYVKSPRGVAADRSGNVYFCNSGKHTVCQVAFDSSAPNPANEAKVDSNPIVIAGTGTMGKNQTGIDSRLVQLNNPAGIRVFDLTDNVDEDEEIYFLDKGNKRICKLIRDKDRYKAPIDGNRRIISVVAGDGNGALADGAVATRVALGDPSDFDLDPYGNIYLTDAEKIWRIDRTGIMRLVYPRSGQGVGKFTSIAVNVATDGVLEIYFTTDDSQSIRKLYL